jgi:hypothetical protein
LRKSEGIGGFMETAYLSSKGRYTIFRYGDTELKIIAPYSLERYEDFLKPIKKVEVRYT